MINFSVAAKSDNLVLINWQTLSETNNDFFVVERSEDGMLWSELALLDGQGNSSEITNYQITDFSPVNGKSYYRIKQVDFDGSFSYSLIKALDFFRTMEYKIFPNPTSNIISFHFRQENPLEHYQIYNSSGMLLNQHTTIIDKDSHNISLDVSELAPGFYTFTIRDQSFRFSKH